MVALVLGINPQFGSSIDIAKALAFFTAFSAWIAGEVFTEIENIKCLNPHDADLYNNFMSLFNRPTMLFLRDHQFESPFFCDISKNIFEFAGEWDDNIHQFEDKKLNRQLDITKNKAKALSRLIALKTYPHLTNINLQVAAIYDEETGELLEDSKQAIDELNQVGGDLHKEVETMYALGRKAGVNLARLRI